MIVTRNGGAQHKLIFTKNQVELKLREGTDEKGEAWIRAFVDQVVKEAMPYADRNIRGRIRKRKVSHVEGEACFYVTLHYPNRGQVEGLHFCSCRMTLPAERGNL